MYNITYASKKAWIQIILGGLLFCPTLIILSVSLIKSLYTQFPQFPPILQISHVIYKILGDYFWTLPPNINMQNIFSSDNRSFQLLIVIFFIGAFLLSNGRMLLQRIYQAKGKAQNNRWEHEVYSPENNVIYQNSDPISKKSEWYKRPIGIILLSVISGYLILLLGNISGL